MARAINRLTARTVATLKEPGLHADGSGLYLRIDQAGARRWVLIYHHQGRRREMGLGSASTVDLKAAREAAARARALPDPIGAKRVAEAPLHTFERVMDTLFDDLEGGWKEGKHKAQWRGLVTRHGAGLLAKPVADIGTEDVLAVLRPLWTKRPETARRLRQRVEKVLDAARVRQLRSGENPARWKGHLDLLLARQPRLVRGHHKAMPWRELPPFMAALRQREALAARALEFTILTGARTGETLGATWPEIVGDEWVIPAARMKGGRPHRVPLSDEALAAIGEPLRRHVFSGDGASGHLSTGAMERVLDRMGLGAGEDAAGYTVHGFRSTFRDWAAERTAFPREVVEAALAHTIGSEVELAYRRTDFFEKRRALMEQWAIFCGRTPERVVIPFPA